MIDDFNTISNKAKSNIEEIAKELNKNGTLEDYDLLVLLVKYMVDLYYFEVHNYQENRAIPQIISRTIMETYFYVCYLTKGKSDMTEYQIKKEAYKLIARRDEIKKLINSLFNQQLINTNNYKDMIQREKARDLVKEFPELETKLKERKENINDEIKKFLEKNSIDIEPNKFTDFYNVSKDEKGSYLKGLQKLAIYVDEGERYNLLMHQTSKRVHATNVYEEYDISTMETKNNKDDNMPIFNGAIFVGNALKAITEFCNIDSLLDNDLSKLIDTLRDELTKK